MQTTDKTSIGREQMLEILRRELQRTPAGVYIDFLSPVRPRNASEAPPVSVEDQPLLGFCVSKKSHTSDALEFLHSILAGMKIDISKVQILTPEEILKPSVRWVVKFGEVELERSQNESLLAFETLEPQKLKSNAAEKKKLWMQLKEWLKTD